jgi:hypothetical protein
VEYVALAVCCGLSAGVIARIKGGPFWLWFLIGSVLPVLGTIAVLFSRWEGREPRRSCPECGNVIPLHDQVCMRCGADLEFPLQQSEPPGTPA